MKLTRLFYWLFSISLLVLFVLLGYGWTIVYKNENKKLVEDIDRVVQATADTLQNANWRRYDMFKVLTDKDYSSKIAFAAGLTQNQKKMSWGYADSTPPPPSHLPGSLDKKMDSIIVPAPVADTARRKITGKTLDTMRLSLPKGMTVAFGDTSKLPPPVKLESKKHDSMIMQFNITGEKPMRVAMNKKAIDTAEKYVPKGLKTINYYDSLLTVQLQNEGILVPYKVEKVERPLAKVKWASTFFIIDFYDPIVYRVVYILPNSLLARRLLPYTGISLFLMLLVSAAFLLYHKSYKTQLQTAQFRESLLSNVTHELKTPVASLQLIINSLQQGQETEAKQQEYVAFAGKELTRMKTLIEKILSFSKLNERQFALNKEIINVGNLIREAIEIISPAVANVCGTVQFEQQADPELLGDRILILNMVINIIDNALKYSLKKPTIHITLTAEKGSAKIRIMDNGIGIPAQFQKKIFEPFFRVPTGSKYDTPGHGIGLSFVKQTVKLHGGTISVSSEKEEGSTFIIRLPSL